MNSYQYLSHTADIRLKVEAKNIEELFTVALDGMNELIKNGFCTKENNTQKEFYKEKIEISSQDATSLLIDFLSEVLTYTQINKVIYCKVKFEKLTNNFLKAIIYGKNVETFDKDIKAVTYHEAQIKQNNNNLETIIVFDI